MSARSGLIDAFKTTPGALKFAPEGETFPLKAGGRSAWYIDCRGISYGQPQLVANAVLDAVANVTFLAGHLGEIERTIVFGPAFGAIPIAVGIGYRLGIRSGTIRPTPKDHGVSGQDLVVGPTRPGDRVLLVEDVWTTGSTLDEAYAAICDHYDSAEMPFDLVATVVLVNRAKKGTRGHDMTEFWGAPFISVLRPFDIGAPDE